MRSRLVLCVLAGLCAGASADGDGVYAHEAIGPLHTRMTAKQLVDVLGAAATKPAPVQEAATGQWVTQWQWADSAAVLVSDHADGPWTARGVSTSRASWSTNKGIHVGSTRDALRKAYTRTDTSKDSTYLVGSPYGGMLFTLDHDTVASIAIDVFAF
jgi:hypothetical protein